MTRMTKPSAKAEGLGSRIRGSKGSSEKIKRSYPSIVEHGNPKAFQYQYG